MKKAKKIFSITLMAAVLCLVFSIPTFAAATRKCYTITSGNTVVYSNTALTNKYGTIYGSDEITVLTVTDRYSKVTYPISGGRTKTGYIRTSAILTGTTGPSYIAKGKITTYKRPGGYTYGYVSKGDNVKILGTYGSYTQVKYPVSGGYKYGFVTTSNAQKYIEGSGDINYSNISEGTYKITTALNTNYALDVNNYATFNGGNVEIYPYHDSSNEKWIITSVGNGYYRITDSNSGKSLDVNGASSASGTNVQIWERNDTNAQKWRFVNAGNGYYYIVNANGCYLDVQNGTVTNGNNVWVYSGNGTNAQKWKLSRVTTDNKLGSPVPNGCKFSRKTNDSNWYGYHDINRGVSVGTPVYAIADGKITCRQAYRTYSGTPYLTSYGNYIEFSSKDGTYTAKYCHLNSFRNVSQYIPSYRTKRVSGSTGTYTLATRNVSKGEIIGYIGTTGNSTGAHLHFELRKNGSRIDPTSVISGLI